MRRIEMLIDKGFSHAIANAVLENDPENKAALNVLAQPKNRLVTDGKTFDLDAGNEIEIRKTELLKFAKRIKVQSCDR